MTRSARVALLLIGIATGLMLGVAWSSQAGEGGRGDLASPGAWDVAYLEQVYAKKAKRHKHR